MTQFSWNLHQENKHKRLYTNLPHVNVKVTCKGYSKSIIIDDVLDVYRLFRQSVYAIIANFVKIVFESVQIKCLQLV